MRYNLATTVFLSLVLVLTTGEACREKGPAPQGTGTEGGIMIDGSIIETLPGTKPYPAELQERILNALAGKGSPDHVRTRHLSTEGNPLYTNRLILEVSPYLLQHAHNPVNWYPWGEEAFAEARESGRLIFLSIGYSTCHWCHVMEEESFDDLEVAKFLNEHFIAVKVDREERPDIDNVYMTVCQAMTGSGGWPLTIVMTPEGKPVFAGTYFPKRARLGLGMQGLLDILPRIASIWKEKPDEILKEAERITSAVKRLEALPAGEGLPASLLDAAFSQLSEDFDPLHGGFGNAPKFPSPHNLTFLLRYWKRTHDSTALDMVEKTLTEMRLGGIYDQLGFGFHRYSTDAGWRTPHFEKMLYDQAGLATAYIEAYQVTGNELFAMTTREIFTYILRDMTSPEGGFASAQDADSEGEEGKFYLWTAHEIRDVLGEKESRLLIEFYNVEEGGNFSVEYSGRNILYLNKPLDRPAEVPGTEISDLLERLEKDRERLFTFRERRVRPLKDDKILAAWNGLMISALSKGYQALGDETYVNAARNAADFILSRMMDEKGRLVRRYRHGIASLPATLNDYAFVVQGLLDLYETDFDIRYLKEAIRLNGIMLVLFLDDDEGALYLTAADAEQLLLRRREVYDGAIPSGNSIAVLNLLRLWRITGKQEYGRAAGQIFQGVSSRVSSHPASLTQLLSALDFQLGPTFEVVIAGAPDREDTRAMIRAIQRPFLPNKVVILRPIEEGTGDDEITQIAGYTRNQTGLDGKATAYVCRDFACRTPTDDIDIMLASLGIGR